MNAYAIHSFACPRPGHWFAMITDMDDFGPLLKVLNGVLAHVLHTSWGVHVTSAITHTLEALSSAGWMQWEQFVPETIDWMDDDIPSDVRLVIHACLRVCVANPECMRNAFIQIAQEVHTSHLLNVDSDMMLELLVHYYEDYDAKTPLTRLCLGWMRRLSVDTLESLFMGDWWPVLHILVGLVHAAIDNEQAEQGRQLAMCIARPMVSLLLHHPKLLDSMPIHVNWKEWDEGHVF